MIKKIIIWFVAGMVILAAVAALYLSDKTPTTQFDYPLSEIPVEPQN